LNRQIGNSGVLCFQTIFIDNKNSKKNFQKLDSGEIKRGKMSKKEQYFKRIENKFVVLEYSFDEINNTLQRYIPLHTFDEKSPYTMIRSIYLDDEKFTIFQEYLSRRKFRFKIRFRNYGHRGKFDKNDFWAELKVKHHSVCYKKRFLFPHSKLEAFIAGENILNIIKKLNPQIKDVEKTYNLMAELIRINDFKPVLVTSYERAAFQNKSKTIRITVDHNISHKSLIGPKRTKTLNAIVFESKISKASPLWYNKMENRLSLLPQKRFSKYATGINSTYFPARGIYNFYTNFAESVTVPPKIEKSLILLKREILK